MKQEYIRKRHVIFNMDGDVVFTGKDQHGHPSVNAAKRESRKLQGTALGQGLLHVER